MKRYIADDPLQLQHEDPMPTQDALKAAIDILTEVHTRDSGDVGFYIQVGVGPNDAFVPTDNYVNAWRVLREFIGKQVRPE